MNSVDAEAFYAEYHGHPLPELNAVYEFLRGNGKKIVWLMGDSSLDNKHWLYAKRNKKISDPAFAPALNGFEHILSPPKMVQDVAFHLNKHLEGTSFACINAAVEESTVSDRQDGLLPHDIFVRDRLQPDDVIIISLGGNDIALKPSTSTMLAIGALNFLTPTALVSAGWGPGFSHLKDLFCTQIQRVIELTCEKQKPALVVPCTIYYPAVKGESWANKLLDTLGYSEKSPHKLQALIDSAFKFMTSEIKVDHVKLVPLALSTVLDCNDPSDYDNRVEPSIQGGAKMGARFAEIVKSEIP